MASKRDTPPLEDKEKVLKSIVESLEKSCENENWGLMVEAAEDYQRTCYKLKHTLLPESKCFTPEEKNVLGKISAVLFSKYCSLHQLLSVKDVESGSYQNIDSRKIYTALDGYAKGTLSLSDVETSLEDCLSLPNEKKGTQLSISPVKEKDSLQTFLHMPEDEFAVAIEEAMKKNSGSLLMRQDILPGYRYLNITINKIELKDPENYFDPFITVSVKSLIAEDIEKPQDTPVVTDREASAIVFNLTVQIQRPLEEIPGGSAIFLEFKHHKSKKDFVSTKCFSFMEMDEIKPGRTYLEIYKKPTDFRRKKLSLLSAKALYLHLNLSIEKP